MSLRHHRRRRRRGGLDRGDDVAEVWIESTKAYDADGSMIESLGELYDDVMWQLLAPNMSEVFVGQTQLACEAGARR